MKVVITGATGLIGSALAKELAGRGDHVIALSRNRESAVRRLGTTVQVHVWADPVSDPPPAAALQGADAVVHLLGEPIAQRWSAAAKRRIHDSRVLSTRGLAAALRELPDDQRPRVLISQSATGYYGPRGEEQITEDGTPGSDFLADITTAWEAEALGAAELSGQRVVVTRTGVVLSPSGGALEKMLPPFRLGIGGPIAGGRQYVPWIHLDDVCAALIHLLDDEQTHGPVNLTAPTPVTNAELSRTLGKVLRRPAVLPIPGFAVRLIYGEMASTVTTGQRVIPRRLLDLGYRFRYSELEPALRAVLEAV
jgi:uncharacterized protein